jgi:hypothetical protein
MHQYCQGLNGGYTSLTYLWGSLRNMLRTGKWKCRICLIENDITTVWNIMILFQACKKRLYKMYGNGTWFFGVPVVLTQDRLDCFRLQPPQTVSVSFSWLHSRTASWWPIVSLASPISHVIMYSSNKWWAWWCTILEYLLLWDTI